VSGSSHRPSLRCRSRGPHEGRWRGAKRLGLAATLVATGLAACVLERTPPSPTRLGVASGWTPTLCRAAVRDRDADGLDDECELSLAHAFAPELRVDPRDCIWTADARGNRLDGGYLFAVEAGLAGERLRIAYLPAYVRDCGWHGPPCVTRARGCSAHDGDSELIVVAARYDSSTDRWLAEAVFLSAHCFGRSAGRCRWYEREELRRFAWAGDSHRGAPRVWVARGKHGNYPSPEACDSGHWAYDSCDGNSVTYRFPVSSAAQNIGSRRHPLPPAGEEAHAGCIEASAVVRRVSAVAAGTRECFWDPALPFRGWQRSGRGQPPTPYARVLEVAAGF
jgi:hypothetical protein